MSKILNITNGDSSVEIMNRAGVTGDMLPWRDVLHEGPVPLKLSLDELSAVRAKYISGQGWGNLEEIQKLFIDRDATLKSCYAYEKVVLWFEHDLYDQLQILQILDWFSDQELGDIELSLICTDNYLGLLSPDEMVSLSKFESPVNQNQLNLARRSWQAYRADTPQKWFGLLNEDSSALPFLKSAIERVLEEYPNQSNGLSRTELQALNIIFEGEKRPERIFHLNQQLEARKFLGDSSFWNTLYQFLESFPPLITLPEKKNLTLPSSPDQELTMTKVGEDVLHGTLNWLDIIDVDRWIGGVHLTSKNLWNWDSENGLSRRGAGH